MLDQVPSTYYTFWTIYGPHISLETLILEPAVLRNKCSFDIFTISCENNGNHKPNYNYFLRSYCLIYFYQHCVLIFLFLFRDAYWYIYYYVWHILKVAAKEAKLCSDLIFALLLEILWNNLSVDVFSYQFILHSFPSVSCNHVLCTGVYHHYSVMLVILKFSYTAM